MIKQKIKEIIQKYENMLTIHSYQVIEDLKVLLTIEEPKQDVKQEVKQEEPKKENKGVSKMVEYQRLKKEYETKTGNKLKKGISLDQLKSML